MHWKTFQTDESTEITISINLASAIWLKYLVFQVGGQELYFPVADEKKTDWKNWIFHGMPLKSVE